MDQVARELGVDWHTIMRIVTEFADAGRRRSGSSGRRAGGGVDETSFLRAIGRHATLLATGIIDLSPNRRVRLLEACTGRSGMVLAGWLAERDEDCKQQIATASLDPFRGYATALAADLPGATRVLDLATQVAL